LLNRKKEMLAFIDSFKDMPDRLLKYNEILLEGEDASPYCYQDYMSYRRLAVSLTSRCNLTCKWCFRMDSKYKNSLDKDLNIEVYKSFIKNTKGKFRQVHLAGLGEPTLYPQLIEAIQLSKNLSSDVKFTTNGVLLSCENVDNYVKAGLTHLEVSIDAFDDEKHKEYRNVDIRKLHNILIHISNNTPLHLQINSVVSTENAPWLSGFVSKFKDVKNINVWHTIPLFETSQMRDNRIKPLDDDSYKTLLLKTENEIKEEGLNWKLLPSSHGVRVDPIIEMKRRQNICFSCFDDPYIGVNGQFNFCPRQEYAASGVDVSVGFEEAWNQQNLRKFRMNMLKGTYPEYCGKLCFLEDRSKN